MSDSAHRRKVDRASLSVSKSRLENASTRAEVLKAIEEIIVNLVGSEELAILTIDGSEGVLKLAHSFGIDPVALLTVPVGNGTIGGVASSGRAYIDDSASEFVEPPGLTACVPLSRGEDVVGVIAIFRLLPQKSGLTELDRDLLEWLGTHGTAALERTSWLPDVT